MECYWCRIPMEVTSIYCKPRSQEIIEQTYRCNRCFRTAIRDYYGQITWINKGGEQLHSSHDK